MLVEANKRPLKRFNIILPFEESIAKQKISDCIQASLDCLQVIQSEKITTEKAKFIAKDNNLPVEQICDLGNYLMGNQLNYRNRLSTDFALFVNGFEGATGKLEVELTFMEENKACIPSPELMFNSYSPNAMRIENNFFKAMQTACDYVFSVFKQYSNKSYCFRYRVYGTNGKTICPITGNSLGALFSLLAAKLLVQTLDSKTIKNDDLLRALFYLDLSYISVTASLNSQGELGAVGGLWEKTGAILNQIEQGALLQTLAVSTQQSDIPPAYLQGTGKLSVIQADNFIELVQKLDQQNPRSIIQWQIDKLPLTSLATINLDWQQSYQQLPLFQKIQVEEELPKTDEDVQKAQSRHSRFNLLPSLRSSSIQDYESKIKKIRTERKEYSLRDLLTSSPNCIVLAPPGNGKSTLQAYIARNIENLTKKDENLVALPVSLKVWQSKSQGHSSYLNIVDYLAAEYAECCDIQQAVFVDYFNGLFKQDKVLLLLDGLDEIERDFEGLKRLRERYPSCQMMLTCRSISFERYQENFTDFPVYYLDGMSDEQQQAYIEAFPAVSADYSATVLFEHLRNTPDLKTLAANPLLLSLLCYFYDRSSQQVLPDTRGQLYHQLVNHLLQAVPRVAVVYPATAPNAVKKHFLLADLALFLFVHDEVVFSEESLTRGLLAVSRQNFLAEGSDDALREDFVNNCGLLRGSYHSGFHFLHLTFQEYLVAYAFASRINRDGWDALIEVGQYKATAEVWLDKKAWDGRWHEVICLCAGLLDDPMPLFDLLLDEKKDDVFRHRLILATLLAKNLKTEFITDNQSLFQSMADKCVILFKKWGQENNENLIASISLMKEIGCQIPRKIPTKFVREEKLEKIESEQMETINKTLQENLKENDYTSVLSFYTHSKITDRVAMLPIIRKLDMHQEVLKEGKKIISMCDKIIFYPYTLLIVVLMALLYYDYWLSVTMYAGISSLFIPFFCYIYKYCKQILMQDWQTLPSRIKEVASKLIKRIDFGDLILWIIGAWFALGVFSRIYQKAVLAQEPVELQLVLLIRLFCIFFECTMSALIIGISIDNDDLLEIDSTDLFNVPALFLWLIGTGYYGYYYDELGQHLSLLGVIFFSFFMSIHSGMFIGLSLKYKTTFLCVQEQINPHSMPNKDFIDILLRKYKMKAKGYFSNEHEEITHAVAELQYHYNLRIFKQNFRSRKYHAQSIEDLSRLPQPSKK